MSDVVVEVDQMWKKFHRGELHDSLRDLIPAVAKRLVGRGPKRNELAQGDFWALRDISFQVRRGETLGIIGPNGAGKSTLLKILSRILRPNCGTFRVRGNLRALIEVAAGFHPDLTGRENIYLNGAILGMRKSEIDRKLDAIVAFSGIEPFIDTPVKRYSSGMQARLGFSVAAHLEPDVFLVDEVLAVGDAVFQEKCLERMDEIAHSGAAIIFISHDLRAVASLCERSMLLRQGQIQTLGGTNEVIGQYASECHVAHDRPEGNAYCRVNCFAARGADGRTRTSFASGERVQIQVEIEAHRTLENTSLEIFLHDKSDQVVFRASTLQLGREPIDLHVGDRLSAVFELDANLGPGVFGLGLAVRRIDHALNYLNRPWLMPWHVSSSDRAVGVCFLNCRVPKFERDGASTTALQQRTAAGP